MAIRPAATNIASDGKRYALPIWLRLAYSHLGLHEIVGPHHNAEILGWWERLSLPFKDDETPWCAGFVNAMVQAADLPIVGQNRAAALGWRWNGYGTRLDGPALGAIMSMERPGKPGSGHMTFVAGRDKNGNIMGLGGNQGNMVSYQPLQPYQAQGAIPLARRHAATVSDGPAVFAGHHVRWCQADKRGVTC